MIRVALALEDGDIDAAVDTVGVGEEFTKENDLVVEVAEPFEGVAASLEPGQSAFVVQQGNDDLLRALDANIVRLRESGRLADILEDNGLDPATAEPGEARLIDGSCGSSTRATTGSTQTAAGRNRSTRHSAVHPRP